MKILFLLSLGLNALFVRSYIRSYAKRERRRMREEHERYRLAFMENLRRIHADRTPGFPKALAAGAGSSGDKKAEVSEMASCVNCEHLKAHNCKRQCLDLPSGRTCGECAFFGWCSAFLGNRIKADNTSCDYEPVRFREKKVSVKQ